MRVATWLREQSGVELLIDERSFVQRRNLRGNPTTQARLAYRGPNPQPTPPKLKLDLATWSCSSSTTTAHCAATASTGSRPCERAANRSRRGS